MALGNIGPSAYGIIHTMQSSTPLEELEQRLYAKEARRPDVPQTPVPPPPAPPPVLPPSPPPSHLSRFGRSQILRALWVVIGLAVLIAAFIFWRGFFIFEKDKVELAISAPDQVTAGEEITWRVLVKNRNRSALTDGELIFSFPAETSDTEGGELVREKRVVPSIPARGEVQYEFSGVVLGGEQIVRTASVSFSFEAEKSNLSFHRESKKDTRISSFPIELSITGPSETISGETVRYTVRVANFSPHVFSRMQLRFEYPPGFIFTSSDRVLDASRTYLDLEDLVGGERQEVTLTGTLSGEEGASRIVYAFLDHKERNGRWEQYKEQSHSTAISPSPLSLTVSLGSKEKQVVGPGEELVYRLRFKNNFDVPLSRLTLSAVLTGSMIDLATLDAEGSFDTRTSTLTWTEAHTAKLSLLRPGEEGEVLFTVSAKKGYVPLGVTNPSIILNATLSSATQPPGLDVERVRALYRHETKVRGTIELSARAYYVETLAPFRNSGPYPPRVGEESTFTVHWQAKSLASAFRNVTISAPLPSGVEWAGQTYINGPFGELWYEEATRRVTWFLPDLKANQGLLSTVPVAVFQLRARPSPAQRGSQLPLLLETVLAGEDVFTATEYRTRVPSLDSGLGTAGGKVE
jgi:hypothetical protein